MVDYDTRSDVGPDEGFSGSAIDFQGVEQEELYAELLETVQETRVLGDEVLEVVESEADRSAEGEASLVADETKARREAAQGEDAVDFSGPAVSGEQLFQETATDGEQTRSTTFDKKAALQTVVDVDERRVTVDENWTVPQAVGDPAGIDALSFDGTSTRDPNVRETLFVLDDAESREVDGFGSRTDGGRFDEAFQEFSREEASGASDFESNAFNQKGSSAQEDGGVVNFATTIEIDGQTLCEMFERYITAQALRA